MHTDAQPQDIIVSAPGKIILFGEHAVVYQHWALAGAIDLRVFLHLRPSASPCFEFSCPELGFADKWEFARLASAVKELGPEFNEDEVPPLELFVPIATEVSPKGDPVVIAFLYVLLGVLHRAKKLRPAHCMMKLKLPTCVGLGSSGAYSVCIASALLQLGGLIPAANEPSQDANSKCWPEEHLRTIRKWASAAESYIHGRASGVDVAICAYGGLSKYKSGEPLEHLHTTSDLQVLLVNSRIQRRTRDMVELVQKRRDKFPGVIDAMFKGVGAISLQAVQLLSTAPTADTFEQLDDLCHMNNQILAILGVSHSKIERICVTLSRYGIHPKITGAGGGGSVFAFIKPETPRTLLNTISNELRSLHFDVYMPKLGGPGLLQHAAMPHDV